MLLCNLRQMHNHCDCADEICNMERAARIAVANALEISGDIELARNIMRAE